MSGSREISQEEYKNLYYRILDDLTEIENRMYQ